MGNLKVLVIDDNPTTCSLLETALKIENYQTASASRIENEDIISLLNQERPEVLVLDFHLGSTESLKYVAAIRGNTDWEDLPILITSAIDRRRDSLAAGANEFLLKPFNWEEITSTIKKLHNNVIPKEV